jgi:hypothetical protein
MFVNILRFLHKRLAGTCLISVFLSTHKTFLTDRDDGTLYLFRQEHFVGRNNLMIKDRVPAERFVLKGCNVF